MLSLPEDKRYLFKAPFGTLFPEITDVLPFLQEGPVYTVGDVVTYRLIQHGIIPDIAIIDGYTMRIPCNRGLKVFDRCTRVRNPAGTLSNELIRKLSDAVAHTPIMIFVEGEEDLAVIPLVIVAPDGAKILYGQPHQGVVLRTVDENARNEAEKLLSVFICSP